MESICRRCGGKYSSLNKLGLNAGHGDLYCGIHRLPQIDTKVLGIVRGGHAHLRKPLTKLVKAVDTEGCCLKDVDVEATNPIYIDNSPYRDRTRWSCSASVSAMGVRLSSAYSPRPAISRLCVLLMRNSLWRNAGTIPTTVQ